MTRLSITALYLCGFIHLLLATTIYINTHAQNGCVQCYTFTKMSDYSFSLGNNTFFRFKVKACSDVFIGLMETDSDNSDMYEVVMNGQRNSLGVDVYNGKWGSTLSSVTVSTGLDCTMTKEFYLEWTSSYITLEKYIASSDTWATIMTWSGTQTFSINYIGVTTGKREDGNWEIEWPNIPRIKTQITTSLISEDHFSTETTIQTETLSLYMPLTEITDNHLSATRSLTGQVFSEASSNSSEYHYGHISPEYGNTLSVNQDYTVPFSFSSGYDISASFTTTHTIDITQFTTDHITDTSGKLVTPLIGTSTHGSSVTEISDETPLLDSLTPESLIVETSDTLLTTLVELSTHESLVTETTDTFVPSFVDSITNESFVLEASNTIITPFPASSIHESLASEPSETKRTPFLDSSRHESFFIETSKTKIPSKLELVSNESLVIATLETPFFDSLNPKSFEIEASETIKSSILDTSTHESHFIETLQTQIPSNLESRTHESFVIEPSETISTPFLDSSTHEALYTVLTPYLFSSLNMPLGTDPLDTLFKPFHSPSYIVLPKISDSFTETSSVSNNMASSNPFSEVSATGTQSNDISHSSAMGYETTSQTFQHFYVSSSVEFHTSNPFASTVHIHSIYGPTPNECQLNCKLRSCSAFASVSPEELNVKVESLRNELVVDKKTTKRHLRKFVSATDDRASAAQIGYVGALILGFIAVGIVVIDIPRWVLYIKALKTKIGQNRNITVTV